MDASIEEEGPDRVRLTLTGTIDEYADFEPLLEGLDGKELHIDLIGIERINSIGVRNWTTFLQRACEQSSAVVLERCAPMMVQQFNLIGTALGRASCRSVMLPYYCLDCGDTLQKLLKLSEEVDVTVASIDLEIECPSCGGEMEFDDLPEMYLGFLKNA